MIYTNENRQCEWHRDIQVSEILKDLFNNTLNMFFYTFLINIILFKC